MHSSLIMHRDSPERDISMTARDRSVIQAKRSRREIETEKQSVANRIALLQREEIKIWQDLEKSKLKAKEVQAFKRREEERARQNQSRLDETMAMEHREKPASLFLIRRQREFSLQCLKEALQKQKHREMQQIKKQSEIIRMKKLDMEEQIYQEKQAKMLEVKKNEILSGFRKQAFFEDKIKRIKAAQRKKEEEDQEVKIAKEIELLEMEKQEMELVTRIQKVKDLQKMAFVELNKSLSEPLETDYPTDVEYRKYQHTKPFDNHLVLQVHRNTDHRNTNTDRRSTPIDCRGRGRGRESWGGEQHNSMRDSPSKHELIPIKHTRLPSFYK